MIPTTDKDRFLSLHNTRYHYHQLFIIRKCCGVALKLINHQPVQVHYTPLHVGRYRLVIYILTRIFRLCLVSVINKRNAILSHKRGRAHSGKTKLRYTRKTNRKRTNRGSLEQSDIFRSSLRRIKNPNYIFKFSLFRQLEAH